MLGLQTYNEAYRAVANKFDFSYTETRQANGERAEQQMGSVEDLGEQWYAVYTRSNFEKRVATQFDARNIAYYLPLHRSVRRWNDRNKTIHTPLFSGYVFAKFADSGPNRLRILQTPGVATIVGHRPGGGIEAVRESEISAIQKLLDSPLKWEPHSTLQQGDTVRVIAGPLVGVEGIFLRHKAQSRILLSLTLLSRGVAAEIDEADVEPVDASPTRSVRPLDLQPPSVRTLCPSV